MINDNKHSNGYYNHFDYDWLIDENEAKNPCNNVSKEDLDYGNADNADNTENAENANWTENKDDNTWRENNLVYIEEYRVDPYDLKLYNRQEFFEYYGRYLEWDLQDPKKIILRKNIDQMIFRYNKCLSQFSINYLLDQLISTFI